MTGGGEHEWLWNSRCGMMGFSQVMRRRLTRGDRRAATATLCSGVISPWKRQRQQGAQRNLAAAVISEQTVRRHRPAASSYKDTICPPLSPLAFTYQ